MKKRIKKKSSIKKKKGKEKKVEIEIEKKSVCQTINVRANEFKDTKRENETNASY